VDYLQYLFDVDSLRQTNSSLGEIFHDELNVQTVTLFRVDSYRFLVEFQLLLV
jgi:hypothetical protein